MSLASRKRFELEHKVDSITAEFGEWRGVSAPDQPLEKHHTQVLRVTRMLEAFAEGVRADIGDGDASMLACGPMVEFEVLEVHRLWEYFRSKLAQRYVPWLEKHLAAADDLANACYAPAQEALPKERAQELKEPPLVFFSGSSSPVATPRGDLFEGESVPGEPLRRGRSAAARKLPIAMIEIPWHQLAHLPDAPTICHEVGHTVEEDFQLTGRLRTLVGAALDGRADAGKRRSTWVAWLSEVFADVYGTLGAGPAFVSALMDILAPYALMEAEGEPPPEGYPPAQLRIDLNLEALDQLGHGQAAELRTRWTGDLEAHRHGRDRARADEEFGKDVRAVVEHLLAGPYPELGCNSLDGLLTFTEADQRQARRAAEQLLEGKTPAPKDVRQLHSAARLAFDSSPGLYDEKSAGKLVLNRIDKLRPSGARGRAAGSPEVPDLEDHDEAAGRELLAAVRRRWESVAS
jgi:hypothetical protein